MSNQQLGLLVALRDKRALKAIRLALAKGNGVKAAALELNVARSTLQRWATDWQAVGTLVDKYTLTTEQVASLGGSAERKE